MKNSIIEKLKNNNHGNNFPPDVILKEDVKNIVLYNSKIIAKLMLRFGKNSNTIRTWIKENKIEGTSFTFLFVIWNELTVTHPNKFKSIQDLLTTKKQEDEYANPNPDTTLN